MSTTKQSKDKVADTAPSFEAAIARLEEINDALERGEPTLEQAIDLYTEGMKLLVFCKERLTEAEKRIQVILQKDGRLMEEDFDAAP